MPIENVRSSGPSTRAAYDGDQRRVEPAAQERADRHVAGEVERDGLGQQLVDPLERLRLGVGPLRAVGQVPVPLDPGGAPFSHTRKCAGGSARTPSKKVSGGWTNRRVRYWSSANGESVARLGIARRAAP